jgi:hypothetical protein
MQLKVFISSRLEELEEERKAIEEAVSELWTHEYLPFTIWIWEGAREIPSGKHPDNVQSEGVKDSDIYLLILGSEYGDFEYRQSPTHKEYDIACSELEEDSILIYIKEVERREEKLEKWIEEIKDKHTFKSFKNPYQLKDLVKTRLRDLWNKGKWRADIPTIQSVLRKGETFEGDFFKKEPEWIDFEDGFVVERKEVEGIIKNLESDHIQLVWGEPASGKSVILKNIGFKLANENKDVYVVELKKHSRDEGKGYFDDIPGIKDENAVFIVDDTHLLPAECERFVREFKNRKSKAKLIIGSRPTREIRGEHPKEASVFEYLSKTDIHAEDITEEMIKMFLKKEHHFSAERIRKVSKNIKEYKKDLWHLSWALKAYNPEKDFVEEEEIYEKVRDSIREIKLGKDESGKDDYINAEDIFLPLSVFYRYEIPVERNFQEEQLGIEGNKINQLIELSEIVETEERERNRMLSLNHSSAADLYFGAYQAYPSFGRRTKEKILNQKDEDLEYRLFYKYMTSTDPRNAIDIVTYLGGWWIAKRVTLLKKLIGDERALKSIKEGIEHEEDLKKIGSCMWNIGDVNEEVALRLTNRINIDTLSSKIEKEKDIGKIGFCLGAIVASSKEIALELINSVDIEVLSLKIGKEENIVEIGGCLGVIAEVSRETALKLVDAVSNRIEREKNIAKIGGCIVSIADANEEMGTEIANQIDIDILSSKIEKEEDIEKIGSCMMDIAEVSKEMSLRLADRIDIDSLSSKIEQEEDIVKIAWCVRCIGSWTVALKLADRIDIDILSSKIEKEEDIERIGWCMGRIAEVSEVGLELVDHIDVGSLLSKIEKEEGITSVGLCVRDIAWISEEIALKLVDAVSSKIEKEEDIEMIRWCVSEIAGASEEVARGIVNRLNPKLRKELQKEGD